MELENLQIKISASAEGVDGVLGEVRSALAKVAEAYEAASAGAARLADGGGELPRALMDTVRAAGEAGAAAARAFNEAFAGGREAGGETGGLDALKDVELDPLLDDLSNLAAVEEQAYRKLLEIRAQMEGLGRTPQLDRWSGQLLDACVALQELRKGSTALRDLEQRVSSLASQTQASRTLLDMAKSAQQNRTAFDGLDGSLKTYIRDHNLMGQSMGEVAASIEREGAALSGQRSGMAATLAGIREEYIRTKQAVESGATGRFAADGSDLFAEADSAIEWLNRLLDLLGAAGGAGEGGSRARGGGGGSRKQSKEREAEEARRAAEEARRAQEEAWQKALDAQIRVLERKKRLGEISTQQEIEQLERIQRKYAKTAEQRLEMEQRIFEARARLRDEEIAELDRLNQGIIDALRNRYEQQSALEQKRLDESIKSWRDWADSSVAAIQAQIDALDALDKTEERAEQDAAKRRKIDATREMLAYTHDEANREQLERELERLEAEYAKWQRQNALADEKERLRAEQEAIRARAEAEQDALAARKDAVAEQYDELTALASLRAEAERMLASANQQEILDLIGAFAPDYEATGRSLGERLYEGMTDAMGGITGWFEDFAKQIQAIQRQMAEEALAAADIVNAGGGVSSAPASAPPATQVYQTNNFNVPVESPADTARKIQQVSEELARSAGG